MLILSAQLIRVNSKHIIGSQLSFKKNYLFNNNKNEMSTNKVKTIELYVLHEKL